MSQANGRGFNFRCLFFGGVCVREVTNRFLALLSSNVTPNAPSGFDSPRNSSNKGSFQFGDFQRIQKVIFKKAVFL